MSKKGFTLIELLVVVAVLALLASIVFSNLGGAREGARISNALSFQSQTHSLLGSDLVGWWNLDGNVNDTSGYNNHGTVVNIDWVNGITGQAGRLIDDTSTIVFGKNFTENEVFSVSHWVYLPVTANNQQYIGNIDYVGGVRQGWWVEAYGSGNNFWRYRLYKDGGYVAIDEGTFEYERWYFIVNSYDGLNMSLYLDGELLDSISATYGNSPRNLTVGQMQWSGNIVTVDDVRIYSRALTASEIQTLYAQTKDKYLANE